MRCGFRHERRLWRTGIDLIAGIDEAGRGPLAGPVVAAAVILPAKFKHRKLNDSKKLAPALRAELYEELTTDSRICWAADVTSVEDVDRFNILRASHQAMRRAVTALAISPQHVLIDGRPVQPFPFPQTAIVAGDACSFSIAAASVIAKVTRDRIMEALDATYPGYEFRQHKGYPTSLHLARLQTHGPSPIHRRSFLPVAQALLARR